MRLKKAISWLLSAAMVLSMTSLPAPVKAADTEADHQLESPQYIVNITGTDLVKAGMDETKVQVLHEEGKAPTSDSFMWVVRTGECEEHPVILFDFALQRAESTDEEAFSARPRASA